MDIGPAPLSALHRHIGRSSSRQRREAGASGYRRAYQASALRDGNHASRILRAVMVATLLIGGSSRADFGGLLILRPLTIAALAALLSLSTVRLELASIRWPLRFLAALAAVMAIQLIPLPIALWKSLPGHGRYMDIVAASGGGWRPITLTPDLTWNSILALLPALVAILGFSALSSSQRRLLLPILLIGITASAAWGVAQLAGPSYGPLYLYRTTHFGFPVGAFANRNHQAALLAMAFPMLRTWTLMRGASEAVLRTRNWIALAAGFALVPMLLATGSRAGVALGAIALIAAMMIAPFEAVQGFTGRRRTFLVAGSAIVLVGGAALVAMMMGRAAALERLIAPESYQSELRIEQTPLLLKVMVDFLPLGSGWGSFDEVFRGFEPDALLRPTYFNHAHNDAIELVLTGGLPALTVLGVFVIWYGRCLVRVFGSWRRASPEIHLARLGAIMIALLFCASAVDYPLRTPILTLVFAFACCWLAIGWRDGGEHVDFTGSSL